MPHPGKLIPRFHCIVHMRIIMQTPHICPENIRKYTSLNGVMDMFIHVKMDAESNETAPVITFIRLHEDSEMFTKNNIKKVSRATQIVELEKKQGQTWNQRPLKR